MSKIKNFLREYKSTINIPALIVLVVLFDSVIMLTEQNVKLMLGFDLFLFVGTIVNYIGWKLRNRNEEEIEEMVCSKCGKTPVYIACPDHCKGCFIKYEVKGK